MSNAKQIEWDAAIVRAERRLAYYHAAMESCTDEQLRELLKTTRDPVIRVTCKRALGMYCDRYGDFRVAAARLRCAEWLRE